MYAKVDDDLFDEINKFKWHPSRNNYSHIFYAKRWIPYKMGEKRYSQMMHHFVIGKPKVGLVTDHIDHSGLNNQKNNLRHCTQKENVRNISSQKNSTSAYLGVSIKKSIVKGVEYKYWKAQISSNGKVFGLGTYETEELAALAYDRAAEKMHKEFANLNFPNIKNIPSRTRKRSRKNTSGYHGVSFNTTIKRWIALIYYNKKSHFIGSSETKEGAAILYNRRALEIRGNRAVINIIK